MLTVLSTISQVNHLQPLSGNKTIESKVLSLQVSKGFSLASDDKGWSSLNQKASHPIFLQYSFHVLNHQEHLGQDLLSLDAGFKCG